MRRRDLFFVIGGFSFASSVMAADERVAIPTIGFLHTGDATSFSHLAVALAEGLKAGGYSEGQNVRIEYRWADNQTSRLPELASDLVRARVSVIFAAGGPPGVLAAKHATSSIPIVFVASDALRFGLVASLNRPEGNLTGISMFTASVGSKRLELMRQLLPTTKKIGFLSDPNYSTTPDELQDMQTAAAMAGIELVNVSASSPAAIDSAFATFKEQGAEAVIVAASTTFTGLRRQIIRLAQQQHLPAMYFQHEFAADGGLISYGNNLANNYRLAGSYVVKILQGAKPSELPILQPNEFQLVINLTAAKRLGLTVPMRLHAAADEVIE